MTQSATPMIISKKAQQGVIAFHKECYQLLNTQWNMRDQMRKIDLAYIREVDETVAHKRAKRANSYGDTDRLQNITVPVVMPAVEAAVTYQSSVFLTGTPIFGVEADPLYMDQAMQMESVIDENATRGGWVRELQLFFRDGFKYNFSAIEVPWSRCVTASFETDTAFHTKQAKPKEVIWEGNALHRLDPYNTFYDSRVTPAEISTKGEFAGWTEVMSRIRLKQFIAELPDKIISNVVEAFNSGMGTGAIPGGLESFYIPNINSDALKSKNVMAGTNWLAWAGVTGADKNGAIQYKNMYEVSTMYGRIIPSDFGLMVPGANTPQIWKFIIVNHSVVIYAERCTNAHGYIPILFGQPLEDGLSYQTKSLAGNVLPIQELSSALTNSVIASRRRAISDRGIYDPSRIAEQHINSPNPSAKIPVRPSAYGKDLSQSYYPIPFNDNVTPEIMREVQMLSSMANNITGQNPVKQGQFVKGNKTQHEFDSVMGNANGRDQMVSMLYEAQVFTPMKEILKSNILQYQGGTSVFNRVQQKQVNIDPVQLRKAITTFKVSDGLTPGDKLINADALSVVMQQIGSSPQIAAGYNIAPMFSYLMKTQGAHLKEFEKTPAQQAYEQAMAQYQQLVAQLYKQNPDQDPAKVPPQPTPQQYGWNPQVALASQQQGAQQTQ